MKTLFRLPLVIGVFFGLSLPPVVIADDRPATEGLAARLRQFDGRVIQNGQNVKQIVHMLADDAGSRIRANQRDTAAWRSVTTRADWEKYRDLHLGSLRKSLGRFPPVPTDLKARVTRRLEGAGYRIENLVFESRPGLVVTANLYLPAEPPPSIPGILLCHSHHNPKTQSELQDMGMTWARQGCAVLIMDQLGHGERRQHPFRDAGSYPHPFGVGRQDYYFRYNEGLQLQVIGESLIGWMAWDLMRGVDLLLARPGVDRERILLLGAVAGGGDPAAVTAALDPRIQAVVPFNFGGPQPETIYPLPADAEEAFDYAGSGSWESTRNLRLSARDGFLPWMIVGSVAPRRLIYGHEFAWDREHDPVWSRLERIYNWYGARDCLAAAHGRGKLSGKPPESTHCNNIGPEHRQMMYPAFQRWFAIPAPTAEFHQPRPAEELTCLTPEAFKEAGPPLHRLAAELGAERLEAARRRLAGLDLEGRRQHLRREWTTLLGEVEPATAPRVTKREVQQSGGITLERIALEVEPRIVVPLLLLLPPPQRERRQPVVVGFAQEGKQVFLKHRAEALAALLEGGAAVCLPDLRGTGETGPGDSRGRASTATSISATEWMLGRTLVGLRLRDLRSVLRYLRNRPDLQHSDVVLWGDSFAPVNSDDRRVEVPLDADNLPYESEPLGGLVALFGALFEKDVRAVYARGGLVGYHSLLHTPFLYVPHDAVVPGALQAGDLSDVAAALVPRPVRLEALVDGLNRRAEAGVLTESYAPAHSAYGSAAATERLQISPTASPDLAVARWLLTQAESSR